MGRQSGQISGRVLRLAITAFCCQRLRRCLSPMPFLPQCPTHSYLQLHHVFSRSGLGSGGGGRRKTRIPPRRSVTASGTRHNSPRGGRILKIRASTSEPRAPGPLSQPLLPLPRRPRGAPSSRSSPPPPPTSPQPSTETRPDGQPRLPAARALAGRQRSALAPPPGLPSATVPAQEN